MKNLIKNVTLFSLCLGSSLWGWVANYSYTASATFTPTKESSIPMSSKGTLNFFGENVLLTGEVTSGGESVLASATCTVEGSIEEDGLWHGCIQCPSFACIALPFVINVEGSYSDLVKAQKKQPPDHLTGYFTLLGIGCMLSVEGEATLQEESAPLKKSSALQPSASRRRGRHRMRH